MDKYQALPMSYLPVTSIRQDMEGIKGIILLLCIGLNNANLAPTISRVVYEFCEDVPVGEVAFIIEASDPENDALRFAIFGDNSPYFEVVISTGEVKVKTLLERDTDGFTSLRISVAVTDGTTEVQRDLTLLLKDANDNAPLFDLISYDESVPEVSPLEGSSLFSISSSTGEVKLTGQLDFKSKSPSYRLKITATDTTVRQVTAFDQDTGVNDVITYSIQDSTAEGLFKISSDNGIISVASDINRETVGDIVTLTVKAQESELDVNGNIASATTTVQITILDVNDETPKFYNCGDTGDTCEPATDFSGEILEHSPMPIDIQMTVDDLDKNPQTELILEGEDKDVFSVEPQLAMSKSSVRLAVKQPQNLDFEKKQQMFVTVIARDSDKPTFSSIAQVTIKIIDDNDNSPTFQNDTYSFSLPEHSPAGTLLETITANDPDTMDKGKLKYRLLPDSILSYFDVNPDTGDVFVKDGDLLDREARSLYSATLEARDTEDKPGTTVLEITLTDINDKPPVFNRVSYQLFVNEGDELEQEIEATDGDEPDTPNSQIVYEILQSTYSDYFIIDSDTGLLRNRGELDREALAANLNGIVELEVKATDKGTPALSATIPVVINIADVNDNQPEFLDTSYNFTVLEGERGALVGIVHALDSDQSKEFNLISFTIKEGSGNFIIRRADAKQGYMGNITVDPGIELDYESKDKQFTLQVEAADLDQKAAEVTVLVEVLDVNDERPEFISIDPVNMKETTTAGGVEAVGAFEGYDQDTNHSLVFELVSVQCKCNNSLGPCDWFFVEPTGEVHVSPKITVDYEKCVQATVEAQVVDLFTEKGENNSATTGKMVINIEDINDNAPEFIYSDAVFTVALPLLVLVALLCPVLVTSHLHPVGSHPYGPASSVPGSTPGQTREMVEPVSIKARIGILSKLHCRTTQKLDATLRGTYLVTVTATDNGGLSSSTVLEVFNIDEDSRVELTFALSLTEFNEKKAEITRALIAATKTDVQIASVEEAKDQQSRATVRTNIGAYFVHSNGTTLTQKQVVSMVSNEDNYAVLTKLGLVNIGGDPEEEIEVDVVKYIMVGIIAGLVIVLTVLITSLMCTRRTYSRKLKASKAMNSASMIASDNQKGGAVVPGTNKYTMEGANPVLNLNIDTTLALDMDSESSDTDKVSLNSLDEMTFPEKSSYSNMQKIQEEDEDSEPPGYIEPLGAALAQMDKKKSTNNPLIGWSNPAFNTTDL
ncbi:cadherin-related family member 2 [Pholidichthys leucotaenia]